MVIIIDRIDRDADGNEKRTQTIDQEGYGRASAIIIARNRWLNLMHELKDDTGLIAFRLRLSRSQNHNLADTGWEPRGCEMSKREPAQRDVRLILPPSLPERPRSYSETEWRNEGDFDD